MEKLPTIPEDNEQRTAFWTRHIEAWRQSNTSQAEYVRRHGLPIARFSYWKHKLYPSPRGSGFVRVDLESNVPVRIHHPAGMVIECLPGTDIHWLHALLGMSDAS